MLNTDNRESLLSALRPPLGYHFDLGIGTTFTLDLLSLLVTPLALALIDFDDIQTAIANPLVLLESLSRYKDRISIFCQAGRIGVPTANYPLLGFLEDRVIELLPKRGVFHPKVWLLRYACSGQPTIYRLLDLSRNLTFDRCWDLKLQMEGEVDETRVKGFGVNTPLADFLSELPGLSLYGLPGPVADDLAFLSSEVRRVRWQPPALFESNPVFLPIGIPHSHPSQLNLSSDRALIISPFLQEPTLIRLTAGGANHILISRHEVLNHISPKTLERFSSIYTLDDQVEEAVSVEDLSSSDDAKPTEAQPSVDLSGLHAKLYVLERGWKVAWWIGSANATEAGLGGKNVEFLIGLEGKRSQAGVDQILGKPEDDTSLRTLLKPYHPLADPQQPDPDQEAADAAIEAAMATLINARFQLSVNRIGDATYGLALSTQNTHQSASIPSKVGCWPITLPSGYACELPAGPAAVYPVFQPLSMVALTRFMAFSIEVRVGGAVSRTQFVLDLPLSGMPEGREEQILSEIISNRERFLRYIRMLLLLDGEPGEAAWLQGASLDGDPIRREKGLFGDDRNLLESLVRAASRAPERIQQVNEIVKKLSTTEQGQKVLPPDFLEIWQVFQTWQKQENL